MDSENKTELIQQFTALYPTESWKIYGLYTDEYLEHIPSHWLSYKPTNGYVYDIFAVIYSIMAIFGLSANAFTIYMIVSCDSLRTPDNYLIGNLATGDFLMMLKVPIFIVNSVYRGPVLGYWGCQIYGFVGGFSGTLSIITLSAISVDRYYAIVNPLLHEKIFNSKGMFVVIAFIWLYAGFFSAAPLFEWFGSKYTPEGLLNTCSFDYLDKNSANRVFIFVFFLAAWALPLLVLSFMYSRIEKTLKKAEENKVYVGWKRKRDSIRLRKGRSFRANLRRHKKTVHLGQKLTLQWFLFWTPYAVVALMGIFGLDNYIHPLLSEIPAVFCKIGSCTNPYNYFFDHPKFHAELRSKFPRLASFCLRNKDKEESREENEGENGEENKVENLNGNQEENQQELEEKSQQENVPLRDAQRMKATTRPIVGTEILETEL